MAPKRGRFFAVIGGLGVVVVLVLVGVSWRDVYYGLFPERRFLGAWSSLDFGEARGSTYDFRDDGRLVVRGAREYEWRYRVEGERLIFESDRWPSMNVRYRFEPDDILVLEIPGGPFRYRRVEP